MDYFWNGFFKKADDITTVQQFFEAPADERPPTCRKENKADYPFHPEAFIEDGIQAASNNV